LLLQKKLNVEYLPTCEKLGYYIPKPINGVSYYEWIKRLRIELIFENNVTTIKNLPKEFNIKRIAKVLKKKLGCKSCKVEEFWWGQKYIELKYGDKRDSICEYFVKSGILRFSNFELL